MDALNKDEISHKGKRIQKYSLEVKKEVIAYAEVHGNRPASRQFHVDERRIREWRTNKSEIEGLVASKNGKERSKLSGGGRKPLSRKLEEVLLEWMESRWARGLRVSCKLVMKKAEITYRNMKEGNNVAAEADFKASRGWLSRFMKRNGLSLIPQQDPRDSLASNSRRGTPCSTRRANIATLRSTTANLDDGVLRTKSFFIQNKVK